MKKATDLRDMLQRAGSTVSSGLHGAGTSLQNWYGSIDPEAKKAIIRGLIGAGIGGAATGGMAAATPKDPEERGHVIGPALLGAMLGGTAAAGIPYGAKMLTGEAHLPGMADRKPMGSKTMDMLTYPVSHHPALTIGTILGALATLNPKALAAAQGMKGMAQIAKPNLSAPAVSLMQKIVGKLGRGPMGPATSAGVSRAAGAVSSAGRSVAQYGSDIKGLLSRALTDPDVAVKQQAWQALSSKLGLPAGMAAGAVTDKYLRGEY